MEDITKYLNDYILQEKKTNKPTSKKRSRNNKNTEIIQISDVDDNEVDSEEELNERTKNKKKK